MSQSRNQKKRGWIAVAKGRVRTYLTNERPHVFDSPLDLKKHFESHPGSVAALAVPDFFAGDPV